MWEERIREICRWLQRRDILTILMSDLRKEMMCKTWIWPLLVKIFLLECILLTVTVALDLSLSSSHRQIISTLWSPTGVHWSLYWLVLQFYEVLSFAKPSSSVSVCLSLCLSISVPSIVFLALSPPPSHFFLSYLPFLSSLKNRISKVEKVRHSTS